MPPSGVRPRPGPRTARAGFAWLLALAVAGFWACDRSVGEVAGRLNGSLNTASVAVLIAAVCVAALYAGRTRFEPDIHDRQVDLVLGLVAMSVFCCLERVTADRYPTGFSNRGLDWVALAALCASGLAVFAGTRALWRLRGALALVALTGPVGRAAGGHQVTVWEVAAVIVFAAAWLRRRATVVRYRSRETTP